MPPSHIDLREGDCIEVMKWLADNSIDSVVTDPPYHLTNNQGTRSPYPGQYTPIGKPKQPKGGFMGKQWDGGDIAFRVELWSEVLRVLKPGGHVAAFSGTRTYHRMACAIEDAGFEIRDQLAWVYGQGFPKSHDVSKGIDKAAPRAGMFDKFSAHFSERMRYSGRTQKDVAALFPSKTGGLTGCVWNWANGANVPTLAQWEVLQPLLGLSNEWLPLIERIEAEREVVGRQSGNLLAVAPGQDNDRSAVTLDITAPATDAAKQWQGWGTALKPAWEPICLARKPLSEPTIAANVLRWGTGAINVDACRVEGGERPAREQRRNGIAESILGQCAGKSGMAVGETKLGRWPANLCHDGSQEVLDLFPESSVTGLRKKPDRIQQEAINTPFTRGQEAPEYTDRGSAARFFYCSKASRHDRITRNVEEISISWISESGPCQARLQVDTEQSLEKAIVVLGCGTSSEWNMFLFGNVISYLSQLGCKFTISTAISSTIELKILSAWTRSLINACTLAANCETVSGLSPVENAGKFGLYLSTMLEQTVFLPGASHALSGTLLTISVSARRHSHPTTKPVKLMQWLCRLICPPGGTILDPFAGSGTTGAAAGREGFNAILIEREAEYIADIKRRISGTTAVAAE